MRDGKAWGIRSNNNGKPELLGSIVISDPSYFAEGRRQGKWSLHLHPQTPFPILMTADTADHSCLTKWAARMISTCMVSFAHYVCIKDHCIAIVSTTVETSNPIAELDTVSSSRSHRGAL